MIKVLIAEDHDLVRQAMCEALDAEPDLAVVACCANGREAVEALDSVSPERVPDVVITDLVMPHMDGVATTREVRHRWPAVRVVVLTVAPHSRQAAEALAAGAEVVVAKSPDPTALLAAVRASSID